jgi:peptide-methionine (R)-S-oxide reductase
MISQSRHSTATLIKTATRPATALATRPSTSIYTQKYNLSKLQFTRSYTDSPSSMSKPIPKSESEWQAVLSKEQFRVLRQKGTEYPGTGKYNKHYPKEGTYQCAGCGADLYKARNQQF